MPNPALYITDGTTEVQLLRGPFRLTDWRPARAPLKGGGTWRSSPFVDGRRLVAFRRDNIVDTFSLLVQGYTQDELIYVCQEADRLLTKAMQYWSTSWQDEPVYLVARGHGETNARYAHIHSYAFPNAANPYVTPFAEGSGLILAQEDLTVVIEHGTWLQFPPTGHACTLISAENDYDAGAWLEEHVIASTDDAFVEEAGPDVIDLVSAFLRFGRIAGTGNDVNAGMRFQGVDVPQGATILWAYLQFEADFADAGVTVAVLISCEDADDTVTFGTAANFMGRARTAATTAWSPPAWVANQFYYTPDFAASVQEVVDRVGWAAGNNMVVFIDEDASTAIGAERRPASEDHGADLEPVLFIAYANPATFGRDSTNVCDRVEALQGYILKEDGDHILLELGPPDALLLEGEAYEVYVANKTNMANLTHIWQYDDSTGAYVNLINAIPPTTGLFPGAIAGLVGNNDILYFGIGAAAADSGPFCSLVFDIDTAATYTGTATLTWQYNNGGWVALAVRDNTLAFQNTFVNSVHWNPPADWDETAAVNGVAGYWVRCIVTGIDGANPMTNPSQQNRRIYTITWPRYDLNQADIGGDIVALVRSTANNQASNMTDPDLPFNKMWLGLRSLGRGDDFVMHLNVADEQNPTGITCTAANTAGPLAFTVDDTTPTGWHAIDTITAANTLTVTWSMDNTIMPDFWGTYHAFVRGLQHSGSSGDVVIQIITQSVFGAATTHLWSSAYVPFTTTTDWELVDMGRVTLPPIGIAHPTFDIFNLLVEVTDTVTGSTDVTLYDLILLPIDEWAGSFSNTEINAEVDEGLFLDVNSISDPKRLITAVNRVAATGNIFTAYQVIANDHALVQANATQRMYHLFADDKISYPCISCAVWLFTNQQYLNMRGNR